MNIVFFGLKIVLFCSFFCFCSQSKKPTWVTNPPQSSTKMYGAGISNFNYEDARKNALSDISSQIQVNVSSDMQNNVYDNSSGFYGETNSVNLDIKTNDIKITNYKIEDQQLVNNVYYVLISIDRMILQNQSKIELDKLSMDIEILHKQLSDSRDQVVQIKLIKELKLKMEALKREMSLMSGLDLNYKLNDKQVMMHDIYNDMMKISNSISFKIVSDDKDLEVAFLSALSDAGYKIEDTHSGDSGVVMRVNSKFKESIVFGTFVVESNIVVLFSNPTKGNVVQKVFINRGTSSIDYEAARRRVVDNVKKEIPALMDWFLDR